MVLTKNYPHIKYNFFYKKVVFPAQAESSYFSADFLVLFLNYSLWHFRFRIYWDINYKCLVSRSVSRYNVQELHRFSLQSARSRCHFKRQMAVFALKKHFAQK